MTSGPHSVLRTCSTIAAAVILSAAFVFSAQACTRALKNLVLFFDSATRPNTFWVPFSDLDFSAGAEIKKLPMAGGQIYAGNAAANFEPAPPFKFMPAETK